MALGQFQQDILDFLHGAAIGILVIFVAFVAGLAIWTHNFRPPDTITMAGGPQGLGYFVIAPKYKAALDENAEPGERITVTLVNPTKGSRENLDMLAGPECDNHRADPRADVALIAGGVVVPGNEIDRKYKDSGMISAEKVPCLESLGTVLSDPLWLFRRKGGWVEGDPINSLRDKTIAIGTEGSGTRVLAKTVLADHGINNFTEAKFEGVRDEKLLKPEEAKAALLEGTIDAAFFVGAWDAEIVQTLLTEERIELPGYPQAETYEALHPYLRKVVLPAGAGSLAQHRPEHAVTLIATKASLVVRKDLDPAIKSLLLKAARKIHSGQSFFQHTDEFPSAEAVGLPLSPTAQQFYNPDLAFFVKDFLNKHRWQWMPYWVPERINVVVLYVLFIIPAVSIAWRMRHVVYIRDWLARYRINRLHGALIALEREFPVRKTDAFLIKRLDEIEQQAKLLKVTNAYAPMLSRLWSDINLVRQRLMSQVDSAAQTGP